MEKTKIKRCLYVGLGGTGMNAVLHTKKMFIDTYGDKPPMIEFLGVDTDGGVYKKSLVSLKGNNITLSANEQVPIRVENPLPIYNANIEKFSWLPKENVKSMTSMVAGAGQVRTNGRFAFTVNYDSVRSKVKQALASITAAGILNDDKFETMSNEVEIHLIFSVCGGTGCGTFVNMACLLRELAPNCKLTGYAVLPEVFKLMAANGMAKVGTNAYGALLDLDYLMSMGVGSTPFRIEYINNSYDVQVRPFNSVIFVDNTNIKGDTYKHVDELAEMISLALVTSSGALASESQSVSDNTEKQIDEGDMDIDNKKAWASGMGACEILFRGADLAKMYSLKAAKNLVDKLNQSEEDADQIANSWIDSPEVNIRENNNNDNVIDFIAANNAKFAFEMEEKGDVRAIVEQTLKANEVKQEVIDQKKKELLDRVVVELQNLVRKQLNKDGGVALTQKVLASITAQVEIFLDEMNAEKEELMDKEAALVKAKDIAVADLDSYLKKFFKSNSRIEELSEAVASVVRKLSLRKIDEVRHSAAIAIFNSILGMLADAKQKVATIAASLEKVSGILTSDLAKMQNDAGNTSRLFQIDLAKKYGGSVALDTKEVQVSEFLKTLDGEDKILGFLEQNSEDITKRLMAYTDNLNSVLEYKNRTIDDVLNGLDESQLKDVVTLAIGKSQVLLCPDYGGKFPKARALDAYYVGVPEKGNNRLQKDDFFRTHLDPATNPDVTFTSIGMKDRIIVYRLTGVYPAYTIASVARQYEYEYHQNAINPNKPSSHVDNNLLVRMKSEEWSLQPKETNDDDILDIWVKGFMFGLIKYDKGCYQYQSETLGDPLNKYWVKVNISGAKYRDLAFAEFKTKQGDLLKEYQRRFEEMAEQKGSEAMRAEILKAKEDYYDPETGAGRGCVTYPASTLNNPNDKNFHGVAELVKKELKLLQSL